MMDTIHEHESNETQVVRPPGQDPSGEKNEKEGEVWTSAFSRRRKICIVALAAMAGLLSPISSSIFFPIINLVSIKLHVSHSLATLGITTFMIFQGIVFARASK